MDGDAPLDIRGMIARKVSEEIDSELDSKDDGNVFAAAHIAMDIAEAKVLGFEYDMFFGSKRLADRIRDRVEAVHISEGWGGSLGDRETVRMGLLQRLNRLEEEASV
jgi:hypothetical protein